MLIAEAAQFLTATTGIEVVAGQLIDQLKIKFPGQKWNATSEVPEAFVEEIEKLATNAQVQEPKSSLQKADPQNLIEAIKDNQNSSQLIQKSIWEALQNEAVALTIEQAIADTLEIFDIYEDTQQQLLNHVANSRIGNIQRRTQEIREKSQALLIKNVGVKDNRLGELTRLVEKSNTSKEDSRVLLASIMDAV